MHDIQDIKRFYRKKAFLIFGIIIVSMLAYILLLLLQMQSEAVEKQERSNRRFFSSASSYLNSNAKEITNLIEDYHINNNIMLDNLVEAFSDFNYRRLRALSVEEQAELLHSASVSMENCAWLLIVDRNGNVLISDTASNVGQNIVEDTGNEMTMEEFVNLCKDDTDYIVISNPYGDEEGYSGAQLYLYCEAIPGTYDADGVKYILLAFTSQIIDTMEDTLEDMSSWVNDSIIINGGTAIVSDASKDVVIYGSFNGRDMLGSVASEIGLTPEVLTGGYKGEAKIDGVSCYVSTRKFSSELYGNEMLITCVTPMKNLYSINMSVVFWNICLFAITLFLMTAYASYIRGEVIRKGESLNKKKFIRFRGRDIFYSRTLSRKIIPIVLTMVVLLWGAVTYYQTLIMLSDTFSDTVSIEQDIMLDMQNSRNLQKEFKDYYNMQYTSRGELIGVIVSLNGDKYLNADKNVKAITKTQNSDTSEQGNNTDATSKNVIYVLNNSKALQDLRVNNDVVNISLLSDQGYTMATSSNYWNLTLPSEPSEEFYGFWDVLSGKSDHYIEDGKTTDEGTVSKYVGCPMYYYTYTDDDGNTVFANYIDYMNRDEDEQEKEITRHRGLILIEVLAQEIDFILDSARPQYVLENTIISGGFLTGYSYDEEKDDYKVFYSQNPEFEDQYAKELGISAEAFSGNYNGFHSYDSEMYLESFRQGEDYFISTAMSVSELYKTSLLSARICTIYALAAMLLIGLLMIFVSDSGESNLYKDSQDPFALFGKGLQSEGWNTRTSAQKFEEIVKNSLLLVGIIFLLAMAREGYRLGEYSALVYIVGGQWDRGLHIFSVSACILIIIVSAILISIFGKVAHLMAEAFGSRVVTMMHMIIALIKTVAAVLVALYCLYIIGIDGRNLLASAGVMSVVVGLGAQSLVGDLLAGIFIILEGTIRVGDIVTINGIRGKVIDIGLRTTRYEDANQNIRVVCNNELKNFTNMSMKYSVVFFTIPVSYDADINKIKELLNSEFLALYENNRFLKGIPVCQGIDDFGDSSITLRIKFMCEESDRGRVMGFMRNEIRRIFVENNISIPYNQLDIHVEYVDQESL
ncbi:mechanosensitive ion channel family protein [Butyrivibrio sp. AE2032]|uniref:mechanosensitive ion channel family protein n=1 Tax=Butyrivibrio sp. AE2032 TaxID=1458463 RepID=UPI0005522A36|nr:mechanosensitive ion channel family protein [Butyrivibrio sp. AE2032]